MLILQRRKGESLQIGDDITIIVTEISSDRVRLAISAPRETPITRSELLEAAKSNQEAAGGVPPTALRSLLKNFPNKQE